MSSWLVRLFMNLKIEVAIDESCRKERRALDLSHTNIKRVPSAAIARLYNSNVRRLLLQKNYLEELPETFGLTMKKLELLTLDYNELTDLPSSLCLMQNLQFLNISNNPFETFPISLLTLKNLRTLWANGIGIKEVPDEIGRMSSLRFLGLRNNSLTEISPGICKLKMLKWLTFSNNKIQTIPFELCKLKALIHLNLNCNRIVTLPDIWSKLPELRYLFIQSNLIQVDGSVVRQIRELPKLKRAHLTGNRVRATNEIYEHVIVPKAVRVPEDKPTNPMTAETAATDVPVGDVLQNNSWTPSETVQTAEEIVEETIETVDEGIQAFEPVTSSTSTSDFSIQDRLNVDQDDTRTHINGEIERNPEVADNIANPIHNGNTLQIIENNRIIENPDFVNVGDEFLDYQESWEYSESTNSLDDNVSGSDESEFEELPMDSTHAKFGLWGILTS